MGACASEQGRNLIASFTNTSICVSRILYYGVYNLNDLEAVISSHFREPGPPRATFGTFPEEIRSRTR
jgi:hypothetical protein